MGIQFVSEPSNDSVDVVWSNDFIKNGGTVGTQDKVDALYRSDKGYLLIGSVYKGFVFNGSKDGQALTAIITTAGDNPIESGELWMDVQKTGKIRVGFDNDAIVRWMVIRQNAWTFADATNFERITNNRRKK